MRHESGIACRWLGGHRRIGRRLACADGAGRRSRILPLASGAGAALGTGRRYVSGRASTPPGRGVDGGRRELSVTTGRYLACGPGRISPAGGEQALPGLVAGSPRAFLPPGDRSLVSERCPCFWRPYGSRCVDGRQCRWSLRLCTGVGGRWHCIVARPCLCRSGRDAGGRSGRLSRCRSFFWHE